jgi:PPP family 3-phenylpropionic acid transporter
MKKNFGIRLYTFFFFAGFGFLIPFIALYFEKNLLFSGKEIGIILSSYPLLSLFSQSFSGFLSDYTRKIRIFLYLSTAGVICFLLALFFFGGSFLPTLLLFIGYAFFLSFIFPLMNLGILESLGAHRHFYGKIRAWGSLGFFLSAGFLSSLLDASGREYLFIFFALLCAVAFFFIRFFPERDGKTEERFSFGDLKLLNHPAFRRLVFITFVFQVSYASLDGYLGILMNRLGASSHEIGMAWGIGVAAEIPLMYLSGHIIAKIGVEKFIGLGILSGLIRWIVYAATETLMPVFMVQILHGFTFTCLYSGGIHFIDKIFPARMQGSAQGIYDGVSRLFGYFVGLNLMGVIFDTAGIRGVFLWASLLAGVSFTAIILFILYARKKIRY